MASSSDLRIKNEVKFTTVNNPEPKKSIVHFSTDADANRLYQRLSLCGALKGSLSFSLFGPGNKRKFDPSVTITSLKDEIKDPWTFAKTHLFKKQVTFADESKTQTRAKPADKTKRQTQFVQRKPFVHGIFDSDVLLAKPDPMLALWQKK